MSILQERVERDLGGRYSLKRELGQGGMAVASQRTRLEGESRHQYVRAEYLAMGFAAMGDSEKAFEALERAYQARSAGLIYLHLDPGYEPLHSDSRFGELVRKIGLK